MSSAGRLGRVGRVFRRPRRIAWVALCLLWPLPFLFVASAAMSQTQTVAGRSEFDCVIEPQQVVKLASSAVGMLARLDVDRGDIVQQGQVIGKIEDGVEAATLA